MSPGGCFSPPPRHLLPLTTSSPSTGDCALIRITLIKLILIINYYYFIIYYCCVVIR